MGCKGYGRSLSLFQGCVLDRRDSTLMEINLPDRPDCDCQILKLYPDIYSILPLINNLKRLKKIRCTDVIVFVSCDDPLAGLCLE